MWKDYSSGYLKNNRSSAVSVITAAFVSALLLSLLCGLFYNLWKYEVERIARLAEAFPEEMEYQYELLAMYLIRDSQDTAPRLLFPMFLLIMALASFSLIMIIHNSFAASMNARIHQFGILSSVGATPKQIRICLLQEAGALCAVPVLIGNLLGIGLSMGLVKMSNILGSDAPGRHEAVFGYHPLVLGVSLLAAVITIWISAWMPAGKLSRLTPLEAIRNTNELQLKHRKKSPILTFVFGVEGELAGNALKAQRKALRTASLSLVFSFMAFTIMQCFFATSEISTRETYFERYQDAWDIMVTVKAGEVDSFGETEEIQKLPGVESAVVYQKAMAKRIIEEEEMSEEMKSFGGFAHASANDVARTEGGWLVNVPIVIMDDNSFLAYCTQLGIAPRLDGAVILNRIRDVTNLDFRHPRYVRYVKGENAVSVLIPSDQGDRTAEISVLSYTEEAPVLREEYATLDYYELVHFMPVSLWRESKGQIGGAEKEIYIRVLGEENATMEQLKELEGRICRTLGQDDRVESENRIQEYQVNRRQIQGMRAVFGGFCVLLAIIGVGNVFSNTMGFVRQRKREFARYMSVGLTPSGICKMFWIEAMVVALRPILLTLPVAVFAVGYMLKISYIEVGEFMAQAPLTPIAVFVLAILGSVAVAYGFAWRSMGKIRLAEVLRDDTMM